MLRLKEGKEYIFRIEKEIDIPQTGRHFVLLGPDNKKYLIPSDRYLHYNLLPQSDIKCKVDKINCRGEIFLEPRNPWYTEGRTYKFKVVSFEKRVNMTGTLLNVIIVEDRNGNHISVPAENIHELPTVNTLIPLVIERISKGKLYLVIHSPDAHINSLAFGREYDFVIEDIAKGLDDEDYFIIRDPFGNSHTLQKEYYEYYGFKIGSKFIGRIVKYRKNGEKTIEPENPFYKSGSVIKLKVTSVSRNEVNDRFTVNLKDKNGFFHCIELAAPPSAKYLDFKVKMIKKGKPLLLPL